MDQSLLLILVTIALGAILLFFGLRIVKIAVAIIGFLFGYMIASNFVSGLGWSESVLTAVSLLVGLALAIVAFSFYKIAISASVGLFVGNLLYGTMASTGFDPTLTLIAAVVVGAVAFIAMHALKVVEIIFAITTALQGSSMVIVGALALFDRSLVDVIQANTIQAMLQSSGWWVFAWVGLAAIGAFFQIQGYRQQKRAEVGV